MSCPNRQSSVTGGMQAMRVRPSNPPAAPAVTVRIPSPEPAPATDAPTSERMNPCVTASIATGVLLAIGLLIVVL